MLAFPSGEYRGSEQVLLARLQREVYAGSERIEQFTDRTSGGYERLLYVHEDVQGNTRYYTKANGQSFAELTYDAWGLPESPNKLLNNDHGNYVYATYTGHIFDTTLDIYFAEARFYDAATRTWLAMDPIKSGNNWYQYCNSNPVTYWDPLGLVPYAAAKQGGFSSYNGCETISIPYAAMMQDPGTGYVLYSNTSIYDFLNHPAVQGLLKVGGGISQAVSGALVFTTITASTGGVGGIAIVIYGTASFTSMIWGSSDTVEGILDLYDWSAGNTPRNYNPIRDTVLQGNEGLYYGVGASADLLTLAGALRVPDPAPRGNVRYVEQSRFPEGGTHVLPNAEDLKMSQTVQNHMNDVIKKGPNAGQLSRPYIDSNGTTLLLKEIMESTAPVPDAVLQSGLRWDVSGTFRGSTGTWELVVDTSTNTVVHFNFVSQ